MLLLVLYVCVQSHVQWQCSDLLLSVVCCLFVYFFLFYFKAAKLKAAEVEAAAALVIQSFIRMRLARSSHLNKTFISTRLAALRRSKIQRENYIQFRSSVISLQSSRRVRLAAAVVAVAAALAARVSLFFSCWNFYIFLFV